MGLLVEKRSWLRRSHERPAMALVESGSGTFIADDGVRHEFSGPMVMWFPAGSAVAYGPNGPNGPNALGASALWF